MYVSTILNSTPCNCFIAFSFIALQTDGALQVYDHGFTENAKKQLIVQVRGREETYWPHNAKKQTVENIVIYCSNGC